MLYSFYSKLTRDKKLDSSRRIISKERSGVFGFRRALVGVSRG